MASEEWRQEVEETEVEVQEEQKQTEVTQEENQMEAKHFEDTQEEKEPNQMEEKDTRKRRNRIRCRRWKRSFEEADEYLERLVTPKRRKTIVGRSQYPTRCVITLPTRPQRLFTIPIPQGEPTKKRIRIALWID